MTTGRDVMHIGSNVCGIGRGFHRRGPTYGDLGMGMLPTCRDYALARNDHRLRPNAQPADSSKRSAPLSHRQPPTLDNLASKS